MKTLLSLALAAVILNATAHLARCQAVPERYAVAVNYSVGVSPQGATSFAVPLASAPSPGTSPATSRPDDIIRELGLRLLPRESGYLGLIGSSAQTTLVEGRPVAIQSQVYYMLTSDLPVNYLHWLAPDDTHILIEGGPVDYYIFHPDGHVELLTLGRDLAAGERPVIAIPGGCWKALRLHKGATYALMANALSPEFTPDRVKIGAGADWVRRYTGAAPWATEANLRGLIGPNWAAK